MFPQSQQSQTIIQCFEHYCRRYGVTVSTGVSIGSLAELAAYDFVCVTIGGQPHKEGLDWLAALGHEIVAPVPSLFTFNIDDAALRALMGTVVEQASAMIPATSFRASGPLLITHWGMSGPAILKLSSYAARELHDHQYQMPLAVNWCSEKDAAVQQELQSIIVRHPQKQLATIRPFNLPSRLWSYLLEKTLGERAQYRWQHLTQKDLNRLTNCLCNDGYQIAGRAAFKDEFVTCGGVSLTAVDPNTLESKHLPRVFFAGEVLDIDGVTGGFNFQAAWTTAYVVAQAIARHAD